MSDMKRENNFWKKLKSTKVSRSAVMTGSVILAALVIVIAATVATNRAKKNELDAEPNSREEITTKQEEIKKPAPSQPEETTKAPEKDVSRVENELPSFILPVNGTLSKKHDAETHVYSSTLEEYRVHLGIDLVTQENAPVYAAAGGTVSRIWEDPLMGQCIAVRHSGNSYSIYKNLSATLASGITEGSTVRSGQMLGTVGETALMEIAEEPHLHFEMTVADLAVDPLAYFDENALASLKIDASFGE
ncbi:MAG: M23 family metallopeptidase [Ruminococcaceae bacterium]|nr:M23 family metallopeptidase [Oscillospiraceae bacterium]